MQAIVFCGIQASGKSTYFRTAFSVTHVRINLDALRTRRREMEVLIDCLDNGLPFVVDNTNPTPAERARYVQPALAAGYSVDAYWFETRPRDAIARNELRQGRERIPIPSIIRTYKQLVPPSAAEGFTRLHVVHALGGGRFDVAQLESARISGVASSSNPTGRAAISDTDPSVAGSSGSSRAP